MDKISLLDKPRLGKEEYENSEPYQYAKKNFGMFAGNEAVVKLEFPANKVGILIDQFGKDITIVESAKKGFYTTKVDVFVSSYFYSWIMAIGPDVKILGPAEVVEGYKDIIKRQINQY
jgi:hypothetical protein